MPKINWGGDAPTADDVESAEVGFQQYAGEIPPGGVYRFKVGRIKFKEADTGTKGLSVRLVLDGSWKSTHRKFDGCPLWDNVWITKGSAPFIKAFAQAIGVSPNDVLTKCVMDEDSVVTKIGRRTIEEDAITVYVAVRRDPNGYNDSGPRLEKAGTGYQIVDADEDDADEDAEEVEEAPAPAKKSTAKPAKPAKGKAGKGKSSKEDEEAPF